MRARSARSLLRRTRRRRHVDRLLAGAHRFAEAHVVGRGGDAARAARIAGAGAPAGPPPEIAELGKKLAQGGMILTVLIVSIVILMVTKPTF